METFFRYTLGMKKLLVTVLSAALVLGVTSTASASDETLGSLGRQAVAATQAFNHCTGQAGCVSAAARFVRADTKIVKHITSRVGDTINPGNPCWTKAMKLSRFDSSSGAPWRVGQAWIRGSVPRIAVSNAQIRFLNLVVATYQSC